MTASTLLALVGPRGLLVGFVLPVVIVALVAYGVFELVRSRPVDAAAGGAGHPGGPPPGPIPATAALGILDERFARGEIDAEDYVQRRNLLRSSAPATADPPAQPAGDATSEHPLAAAAADDESAEGAQG